MLKQFIRKARQSSSSDQLDRCNIAILFQASADLYNWDSMINAEKQFMNLHDEIFNKSVCSGVEKS
jgi:hypothetical protein